MDRVAVITAGAQDIKKGIAKCLGDNGLHIEINNMNI